MIKLLLLICLLLALTGCPAKLHNHPGNMNAATCRLIYEDNRLLHLGNDEFALSADTYHDVRQEALKLFPDGEYSNEPVGDLVVIISGVSYYKVPDTQ